MKTSLDPFITALLQLARPGSWVGRYRLGVGLLYRQYRHIKMRIPSRHLPTSGFREDLWKNGQGGEMYRHLYFHLACYLLGPPGWVLSWVIGLTDIKQANSGRKESATEIRDNVAGRECGRILTAYLKGRVDERTARAQLRRLLG